MLNNFNTHNHSLKMRSLNANRLPYIYNEYHWNFQISDIKIFEGKIGRLTWPTVQKGNFYVVTWDDKRIHLIFLI